MKRLPLPGRRWGLSGAGWMGLATSVIAAVLVVTADVWAIGAVSTALEPMRTSLDRSADDIAAMTAALDRSGGALALVTATLTDDDEILVLTELARSSLEVETARVKEDISERIANATLEAERVDQSLAVFDALLPLDFDTTGASVLLAELAALDEQAATVIVQLEEILAAPPGPIDVPLAEIGVLQDRIDAGDLVVGSLEAELTAARDDLLAAEQRTRRAIHLAAAAALVFVAWFAAGQWALATFTPPSRDDDSVEV